MITPKLKKSVWVVLVAAALTACGGGGGGSSSGSDTPAPEPTPVAEVTQATAVSQFAAKFDDQINQFTCFKGENTDKCGLILYQVMVEAAPHGGDAPGKIVGWGPDNNKYDGTLEGIGNSLDFIKGVGANALWIRLSAHGSTPSKRISRHQTFVLSSLKMPATMFFIHSMARR